MVAGYKRQHRATKKKLSREENSTDKGEDEPLIFHYLLRVLCFEFKVIEVPYFLDTCTLWEVNDLIDFLPWCDRNIWESQRLNAYITAQVNSTKRLTMQDICKFRWEQKTEQQGEQEITDTDIKLLQEKAKRWEKIISQTHDK